MTELVSVIVPCFNHAKFLSEALQSILNQTHQDWECLIVDDGSPDNTAEVARQWCEKDSRFKYLYKENGGLSSARNYGIQNTKGDYILTLDADDFFEATFIEKALKILIENQNTGIVCCWGYRYSEGKKYGLFKPQDSCLENYLFQNAGLASSLFRKECWRNSGGYDENMKLGFEDWEFYIRVCNQGWDVRVINEPLFFYRQHEVSMLKTALKNHEKEIKKYIFQKHKELYKEHYDDLIEYFLGVIDLEKRNNLKTRNKIDYKLGAFLLAPVRSLKKLFKKHITV